MNGKSHHDNAMSKQVQKSEFQIDAYCGANISTAQNNAPYNPDIKTIMLKDGVHMNYSEQEYDKQNNKINLPKTDIFNNRNSNAKQGLKSPTDNNLKKSTELVSRSALTKFKPYISSGPSDDNMGSNPWSVKSQFDNLVFNVVPLAAKTTKAHESVLLLEKIRKMKSIPQTSVDIHDENFLFAVKTSSHQALQSAFMTSRLSALRKSPARIVIPKESMLCQSESCPIFGDSTPDQIACSTRIDEARVGLARFDPYHSECGPDCRRCFFLKQTLPHLAAKMIKVPRIPDAGKSQKKK